MNARLNSVRVRCLFFAAYRDALGAETLDVELPPGSTVADLVHRIRERSGGDVLPSTPVVALNQEYVSPDTRVGDGDEAAFIPPVAGG